MAWFISRGPDRETRKLLARLAKATERIADTLELDRGARSSPSLRSFYSEGHPQQSSQPKKSTETPGLYYTDDESAALAEEAEARGVEFEDLWEEHERSKRYERGEEVEP